MYHAKTTTTPEGSGGNFPYTHSTCSQVLLLMNLSMCELWAFLDGNDNQEPLEDNCDPSVEVSYLR